MANFFVPGLSDDEAERVYQRFPRPQYPPVHPTARLYSIAFRQDGFDCTATVGQELTGWPDQHGPVLGIIESTQEIVVYTVRSEVRGDLLHVGANNMAARKYFDDYPRD